MHKEFFKCLVEQYNSKKIELFLIFNNVVYDNNFHYNYITDILTASSSSNSGESFGSDGKSLAYYIREKLIELRIKFV